MLNQTLDPLPLIGSMGPMALPTPGTPMSSSSMAPMSSASVPSSASLPPMSSANGPPMSSANGSPMSSAKPLALPVPMVASGPASTSVFDVVPFSTKSNTSNVPSSEQAQELSNLVKKCEVQLKVGLAAVDAANKVSGDMPAEQATKLRDHLMHLGNMAHDARRALMFKTLEGTWLENFQWKVEETEDIVLKCDLHTKMLKQLLASLRASQASAAN